MLVGPKRSRLIRSTGLRELFSERPRLHVVGEAANGVEAISQAVALQPDVIVMDVSMRQMNGIEATHEIHRTLPHIRIVGFSTHDDEDTERSLVRREQKRTSPRTKVLIECSIICSPSAHRQRELREFDPSSRLVCLIPTCVVTVIPSRSVIWRNTALW